ncbi:MAG: amino acid racemase [Nitrospira sp.]|nr:amino acid racemase [Nitrospira sp.]
MDNRVERIPHIGIVAGTADGAALCYRTLCQEAEGLMGHRYAHPEVTLHSFSLHRYLDTIDRDDWAGVAALMSQSAAKLVRAGADVIVCPNNTLHKALSLVESTVPWVHIAIPVVREVVARGWRRVGILGTQTVMKGSVYAEQLHRANIGVIVPDQDDRSRLHHIIRNELIVSALTINSTLFVQRVIADMGLKGAEAVILGCTELPLLMSNYQTAIPLLDSTRLLAQAALRYKVQEERHSSEDCLIDRGTVTRDQERMICANHR